MKEFRGKGQDFELVIQNGDHYIKRAPNFKKELITKEEFDEIIYNKPINTLSVVEASKNILKELWDNFQDSLKNKKSEFGRRVNVLLEEGDQTPSPDGVGVDVRIKLKIIDEKTKKMEDDLYYIELNIAGFTGPLTDREVNYPELLRILHEISLNGIYATKKELLELEKAMKITS